jgi:gliding motility-associated-like protein
LYTVRANIGKCEKQSDIFVKVVPYPQPVVSADTSICIGSNTVIRASGGSFYQWTPDTYLQSPNQAQTQVIQPTSTTRYVVEVRDTLGCPKPVYDTVIVFVRPLPNVSIGFSDTTLVRGQSIRLSASGAQTYQWSPSTGLSATNVASPVASVNTDITYIVKGTSNFGCIAYDTVSLKFYDVYPGMYVPNAFTPNGDGLNDVARPILLGMKELKSFRIYNRYGQLVFETNQVGKGWDGTVDGKLQDMGTYVWYAEGLTFTGQERKQKGTIILIR